jgi:L-ascorbate metabolism protein UlaG (beta-lactamase superfamily)
MLRRSRFTEVEEIARGGEVDVGGVTIRATHADHPSRRSPFGAEAPAVGYVIDGSTRSYFAGDTDLFEEMRELSPGLDLALVPIAGWGFRVPEGHLDPRRAAQALALLQPRVAVPIHWGTYRPIGFAGKAGVLEPPEAFRRHAQELAPDVDVVVLPVGGRHDVHAASNHASPTGVAG